MQTEDSWNLLINEALNDIARNKGIEPPENGWPLIGEVPPKLEMGDLAFPLFPVAKILKSSPQQLAGLSAESLKSKHGNLASDIRSEGAYINIFFPREIYTQSILEGIFSQGEKWGFSSSLEGQKIMLEFSCPNTNKPLHLGHLRNNALGESTSRILKTQGAQVLKVNLINDRGVHICKSMLAYAEGKGTSPEEAGRKSDHFVGDWYVRYSQISKEDPVAEQRAQELLRRWEASDPEVLELWKKMNTWAISGIEITYKRTGVSFDKIYRESETYLRGKDDILEGLKRGVFYKRADGAIVARLPWKESAEADTNAEKVLLRADGTSIYLTQDLGTALLRHEDWAFDRMIYVVASEQDYHFKSLFEILGQLGHSWAKQLHHLSYGMVNLPEGRMKSREGTVVDADNLLDELSSDAFAEIEAKGREDEVGDPKATAEKIALGALYYFLLQATPTKDMIFNPKESLNFNGNTGPYLQYTGARLSALKRKSAENLIGTPDWSAVISDEEWGLTRLLERFPAVLRKSAGELAPSELTSYLYDLARAFSRFYHDHPILGQEAGVTVARLKLCEAVRLTLEHGLELLNIPFLESM